MVWEGSMDEIKSISGGAFYLGGRLVSWLSKKKIASQKVKQRHNML